MLKHIYIIMILLIGGCAHALINVPNDTARPAPDSQAFSAKVITRHHQHQKDKLTINEKVDLTFYSELRRLYIKSDNKIHLDVPFDNIEKVVFSLRKERNFESSTLSGVLGVAGAVLVSPALMLANQATADEKNDSVYWCCIDYKDTYGTIQSCLFSTPLLIKDKIISALGNKVVNYRYDDTIQIVDPNNFKEGDDEFECIIEENNHPVPELKADKALVVIVYSVFPFKNRQLVSKKEKPGKGRAEIVFANDSVIAVIKAGCYSYCYLEPGNYLAFTKGEKDVHGININLEAGKDYYFFQDFCLTRWGGKFQIRRVPKELALYEIDGSLYSTWRRKN